jgi:hypothetical protein
METILYRGRQLMSSKQSSTEEDKQMPKANSSEEGNIPLQRKINSCQRQTFLNSGERQLVSRDTLLLLNFHKEI